MSYVTDRELIEGYEAQEKHIQELGESAVVELDDVNDLNE